MVEVWVVLQPVLEMPDCIILLELVSAGDAKAEEGVEVVRVDLVSPLEGDDGVVVLVVLLIELAHDPPCLSVVGVLLALSL